MLSTGEFMRKSAILFDSCLLTKAKIILCFDF